MPLFGARKALFAKPRFWPLADGVPPAWYADFLASKYKYSSGGSSFAAWLASLGGTYSRASAASYFNSSGVLTQAASGVLRFDYDPVTLAPKGILLEGARTNIFTHSNNHVASGGTSWILGTNTNTVNSATGPDGTTSATLYTVTTGGTGAYLRQVATLSATTAYSVSIFAKKGTSDYLNISVTDGSDGNRYWFNLNTGAVGSTALIGTGLTAVTAAIVGCGNGWYRCSITFTTKAVTTVSTFYSLCDADANLNVTNGRVFYIYGAQLEAGAFASSYIPTTSGTVTRAADSLTFPTSLWFNANEGTLYLQADISYTDSSYVGTTFGSALNISNNSLNEKIDLGGFPKGGDGYVSITTSGGDVFNRDAAALADIYLNNSTPKQAMAFAANDFAHSFNGNAAATDTLGAIPSGLSTVRVGYDASGRAWYGHIRKIGYWTFRVTNSELQRLTA